MNNSLGPEVMRDGHEPGGARLLPSLVQVLVGVARQQPRPTGNDRFMGSSAASAGPRSSAGRGFTLVELLVVIAVIALLAGLLLPALAGAKVRAQAVICAGQMRQLGLAVRLYADDHGDEFPRSQHSAFTSGQLTWGRALAPQLGADTTGWTNLLRTLYRCPVDRRTNGWSYGLNVYFELGPEDDYEGKPMTWRRVGSIRRPAMTVLFAENASAADHIMPNFWTTARDAVDVASRRHGQASNYAFVDGHAEARSFVTIYEPARQVDQWHPNLAE